MVPFDRSKVAVTVTPTSVVEGLGKTWSGDSDYSISDNGTLVYQADAGVKTGSTFVLVDRRGNVQRRSIRRGNYSEFSISPSGRRSRPERAVNDDVWTYKIASGAPLRFTFEPLDEIFPQWTADEVRSRSARAPAQSSGNPRMVPGRGRNSLTARTALSGVVLPGWQAHGLRRNYPSRRGDIWLMALDDDRQPEPLLATDANEREPDFRPMGNGWRMCPMKPDETRCSSARLSREADGSNCLRRAKSCRPGRRMGAKSSSPEATSLRLCRSMDKAIRSGGIASVPGAALRRPSDQFGKPYV